MPSGLAASGRRIGTAYESDYECTTDSDGNQDCTWDTDYDPIRIIESVGARRGYASVSDAIRATQAGADVAVMQEGSRYRPYLASGVTNSFDQLIDMDGDVAAIVISGNGLYTARRWDNFGYDGRVRRDELAVEASDDLGRISLHKQFDGMIYAVGTVSDTDGFDTSAQALAEAKVRPGSHAVVKDGDKYLVVRTAITRDDDDARLDGILVEDKHVQTLEYRGETLVRHGEYFVAPNE